MPRRFAICALALSLTFLPAGGSARDFMSIAYGGISCQAWTDARKDNASEAGVYAAWVFGFVSAYNAYVFTSAPDVTGGIETNKLRAWLDDYCGKRPSDNLAAAVQALVVALTNRKKEN